jgi:hypothetical protein
MIRFKAPPLAAAAAVCFFLLAATLLMPLFDGAFGALVLGGVYLGSGLTVRIFFGGSY